MKFVLKKLKLYYMLFFFQLKCFSFKKERVYIFHIPTNSNMGDQAIIFCERAFFKKYFPRKKVIEVPYYLEDRCFSFLTKKIKPHHLIVIQGGGSMGDMYIKEEKRDQRIVSTFLDNQIIIFPQTITYGFSKDAESLKQETISIFSKHPNLTICAREKISYETMKKLFSCNQILLIPDIVLSLSYSKKYPKSNQILFLIRHDFEKKVPDDEIKKLQVYFQTHDYSYEMYDTFLDSYLLIKKTYFFLRKKRLFQLLKKCSQSNVIITDRLHGMVFAYLTKTPCFVFENVNHKIRGVYDWIKESKAIRLVSSSDEILSSFEEMKNCSDFSDVLLLQEKYQKLIDVIKGENLNESTK